MVGPLWRFGSEVAGGREVAVPTDIDRAAPVLAQHEVDIQAPLDLVWQLHADVNAWPSWQTDITEARIDGEFEPGASFDWSSYGFGVTSTIYGVTDRSRVLWGGTSGGITGIHEWTFEETPHGVHVTTSESFAGEPVAADSRGMQSLLDASLEAWLGHLKVAAEARA
jgi:Polyketide cyclase / dehydrase and lipid transport